jgi:uncharacterized protein YciW
VTPEAAELQAWYVERLRPKLARATRANLVRAAAAAALDERMRALLESPGEQRDPRPLARVD